MNIFWILALGLAMALHPTPCFRHCRQPVYWLKEINRKRLQIAEIVLSIKKLGTKNQMPVPKFATEVHKQPFLHMCYKNTTSKRPANSNGPRVQRRATICYKLIYALRILRSHGIPDRSLLMSFVQSSSRSWPTAHRRGPVRVLLPTVLS